MAPEALDQGVKRPAIDDGPAKRAKSEGTSFEQDLTRLTQEINQMEGGK